MYFPWKQTNFLHPNLATPREEERPHTPEPDPMVDEESNPDGAKEQERKASKKVARAPQRPAVQ